MAKKEITVQFKLQAPGGTATPAPPIGPALGQHGVNPGQFIQQFNAASAHLKGKVIGVLVTVYKDRPFSFELKRSPGASSPGRRGAWGLRARGERGLPNPHPWRSMTAFTLLAIVIWALCYW